MPAVCPAGGTVSARGWVGFDLDKTTALYMGWKGATHIGAPIAKTIERIKAYLAAGVEVRIFTARMSDPSERARQEIAEAVAAYTLEHVGVALKATCIKDYDCVRIYDDIARQVVPNTGIVVEAA
jgi:hypothetical protein